MQICPYCASKNIFFSRKRNKFFCEDCEKGFDTPAASKGTRLFLSYGHDKNAKLVHKIKDYLILNGYDVWIDSSEIPVGKDWRERITNGLIGSNEVLSFLSSHSVRDPGVCLDELKIAVCLKNAYIKTVLLESLSEVDPPKILRNTNWLDMSDWDQISEQDWDAYFQSKMDLLMAALNSDNAVDLNAELEFLSRKLNVYDNTVKQQRLLSRAFVGRVWLTETLHQWLRVPGQQPFMIFGVPGAGKSAFAAYLAQFDPAVLASVFLEWDNSESQSTDTVIKSLAFKLSVRIPDYRRMLCSLVENEQENKMIERLHGSALFDHLILNPLHCCIDGSRETGLIIVDGLDEAAKEVSDLLVRKATQFPGWIKVLFTSRYSQSMSALFRNSDTITLDAAHEGNRLDLRDYLSYRLGLEPDSADILRIAEKSEGSFLYAASFCDAVDAGTLSVDDSNALPVGLNRFYYVLFTRLFKNRDDYLAVRPFLELLSTEDDVPNEILLSCLQLDHYGLWELRLTMQSLVTGAESACGSGNLYLFKTIRFVHQSVKEWLTDPLVSGEYYIDVRRGYRQLTDYYERMREFKAEDSDSAKEPNPLIRQLQALAVQPLSEEQLQQLQAEIKLYNAENEARVEARMQKSALRILTNNCYIKWLILGGQYDRAKRCLLSSFDAEHMSERKRENDYTAYYSLFSQWQWADLFPPSYPVDTLAEKLVEIVLFPRQYSISSFSHRSFQISLLILRYTMDSGRYKEAFFRLMRCFNFAGYFLSGASDTFETRDGWDKYYTARDAVICLKKLEKKQIPVPADVADACERLKLSYNALNGDPMGGMFYNDLPYGILSEPELFKDICILQTPQDQIPEHLRHILSHYNTASLHYYLANSDEEDLEFIRSCARNHADLDLACERALESIQNASKSAARPSGRLKNSSHRIEFIHSLPTLILT